MNIEQIHAYYNGLLADAIKSFWDERGLGSRYRTVLVGVDKFLEENPAIVGKAVSTDDAVALVEKYLVEKGIATKATFEVEKDYVDVIRLKVEGCIHNPVEEKLKEFGIERPITCMCGNLLMAVIEQGGNRTTEMAKVKCENGFCSIDFACFEIEK